MDASSARVSRTRVFPAGNYGSLPKHHERPLLHSFLHKTYRYQPTRVRQERGEVGRQRSLFTAGVRVVVALSVLSVSLAWRYLISLEWFVKLVLLSSGH